MRRIYNKIVIDMKTGKIVYAEGFFYDGPIAHCGGGGAGGGGGGSGRVAWPSYLEKTHQYWLFGEVTAAPTFPAVGGVAAAVDGAMTSAGGNPFVDAYAYDPSTELDEISERYEEYNKKIGKLNELANWKEMLTEAEDGLNISQLSEDEIDAAVDEYETEQQEVHTRSLNRFNASMADINAVTSTAFPVGQALLEDEITRQVAKFRADLTYQVHLQKFNFVIQGITEMARLLNFRITAERDATHLLGEMRRVQTVFMNEFYDKELDISARESSWDLELFQHGANLLAGPGGGVVVPPSGHEPSVGRSAVGGAITGAAAGAMISGGNPVVAGIGALLGGGQAFV